jgi:hypothetical protein
MADSKLLSRLSRVEGSGAWPLRNAETGPRLLPVEQAIESGDPKHQRKTLDELIAIIENSEP